MEGQGFGILTVDNFCKIIFIVIHPGSWKPEKQLIQPEFNLDMVVIDELSSFKSWQTKRFKALMKARPFVSRIVGLTGTPSSNGLMDLFAEFKVLDMGKRLGRFIGQYRECYFRADKMNGPVVYSYA